MDVTQYQKTELDNGIRIITEKIPSVRSVSIGSWLMVGSRNETYANNGISHFIEHMLFKGTETRSAADIAESLESVGGQLNAFTSKELTCYFAHILDEHLPIAVEIIADILAHSVFDEAEIEKEKTVILEELNSIEETPEELIHEIFVEDLFPQHPLGYSIIGKRDNISNFNKRDALQYLRQHYTTDRIVIAAAGNIEHQDLVQLVTSSYRGKAGARKPVLIQPEPVGRLSNIIENGAIQAHLCMGTQAYSYNDRKKFALLVLNTLLGAGMSSRLFQNIREKYGLAYSVYSFIDFLQDTGLFGVYIGTDKLKLDDCIELIEHELASLMKELISSDELQRTRSQLKGNLMLGLESTASRMNRLARMEIYSNHYYSLDATLKEINRVTAEDVLQVSNELFQNSRMHTTILKPRSIPKQEDSKS